MSTMITGKKPIPFLRGMLAHYLIEHGFTFQEAYQVADQVRKALQKEKEISPKKMAGLVQGQSQKLFGDRPIGDGIFWEPVSRQILVEDGHGRHLFSLERLEDSLMVPGLNRDQAHRIAGQIESDFIREDKRIVAREDVFKAALKILKKEGGEE
ncbi:MAG: hypothetical protein O7G87_23075, partial [bacterium]|nr:hypothetical protein [bacterium]